MTEYPKGWHEQWKSIKLWNENFLTQETVSKISTGVFDIISSSDKIKRESRWDNSWHQKKRNELINRANIASTLPEIIEKQLENINVSNLSAKNFSEFCDEFIQKTSDTYPELIPEEIKIIQNQIKKYLNQKRSVQIYLEKYKDNPSEFVKLAFWVDPIRPIEMKVVGANLVLYSDYTDFNMIKSRWRDTTPLFSWEGVSFKWISLSGIENAVLMIGWNWDAIEKHELIHGRNIFIMPERITEKTKLDPLTRGKDEIIAFIRSELLFDEIRNKLLWEGYDYFIDIKNTPEYAILRKKYIESIEKYIKIAEKLVKKWITCDELSITPIGKWHRLNRIKNLEMTHEIIWKKYPDWSYEWKQEFKNWIIFEGVFWVDKKLIVWIKKYTYFNEEWVFLPNFDNKPHIYVIKNGLNFGDTDIKQILKNYERDYKINMMLSIINKPKVI
jgi:hypothetical protein